MNRKNIQEAIIEAKEFIKRAKLTLENAEQVAYVEIGCGNGASGALRRQSMELTRALARLRA
jgi:cell division protein FtsB